MLAIGAGALSPSAGAGTPAPSYVATPVGTFNQPVYTASAPGRPQLLFVVEKAGVVHVLRNGVTQPGPFLDIADLVADTGEQGLLSIAFAPDYPKSRRFYVYFTAAGRCTDGKCDIEVDEFKSYKHNSLRARLNSRRRVIVVPHRDAGNHNGGTVAFGPDGYLWLATGDGGGSNDFADNSRDLGELLGKLLRIDPLRRDPSRPGHLSPPSNPYFEGPGRNEIWSYGLRNPFRFSFDEQLGTVAIGDVGQGQREEVDIVTLEDARGINFGWPQYEGTLEIFPDRPGADPPFPPMHEYANPPSAQAAVTGGLVVRDPALPGLAGRYLFEDFYDGHMYTFIPDLANNEADHLAELPGLGMLGGVSSFAAGGDGHIYMTSLITNIVYRLEQAS
jgi:glucose/arabinose dehydrogenase